MNRSIPPLLFLMSTSCAGQHDLRSTDSAVRAAPPAIFDANPDIYDGKTIYVVGYAWATSHWWSDHVRQSPEDYTNCLNIGESRFFERRRQDLRGKRLVLKGIYKKGLWEGALGACKKYNGLFLDDDYMEKRYPALVRGGMRRGD